MNAAQKSKRREPKPIALPGAPLRWAPARLESATGNNPLMGTAYHFGVIAGIALPIPEATLVTTKKARAALEKQQAAGFVAIKQYLALVRWQIWGPPLHRKP